MSVFRIYVEKKTPYAVEAQSTLHDIQSSLGIPLTGLRLLNRYDVEGIDEETFAAARTTVFSEPAVDQTFSELPVTGADDHLFAIEYLPDSLMFVQILALSAYRL